MVKKSIKKELEPVNVHDRQLMIDLGLHPKDRVIPDFSKTPEEKEKLRAFKRQLGKGFYNQKWSAHEKRYIPVYGKLIIQVKGQSTKSINCNQADISDILVRIKKQTGSEVLNYKWNGRIYRDGELPFWKPRVKGGTSISVRG